MRMQPVFLRHDRHQLVFDFARRPARRETRPVCNAENMRVDRDGGFTESDVEYDIRGLASDTGKLFERGTIARHLPAIFGNELL